ncbi:MAG TPA: S53 family peptidase [Ktedonobacterales bacterium]|nr:S53 family peptidase [Ktedonobacterales bacterium]
MRRTIVRRIIVAAVSIACLAVALVAPWHAGRASASAPSGPTHVAVYTLITGDRVAVSQTPDGRPNVTLMPGSSGAGSIQVLASGQHLYVLPTDAAGYIGQPLSIDLFDVNALTPTNSSSTATQPQLTVNYAPGSAHRLPPGLSIGATGAVTVSNPKAFGRALANQWNADKRGATSHLFAGIARISRAGAQTATTAPGTMYTIKVMAFDRTGRPASYDLGVAMNADDVNMYLGQQGFFRGTASFSVPAGHYSISAYIGTYHPDTNSVDFTLAALPEVNVIHDVTVILDARKGQLVSAKTPQPTSTVQAQLSYQRDSQYTFPFTATFTTFGPNALYATPTRPVTVGKMYFYPYFRLGDAQGGLGNYLYDLEFPYANAIPSTLTQTVTQAQLGTIDSRYHSPIPGRAEAEGRIGISSWQATSVGSVNELVAPLERTEYVTALPDIYWLQMIVADEQTGAGFVEGNLRPYTPGEQSQATWLSQPMVSGIQQNPAFGQPCPVCRSGDTLSTVLLPFTDADGHFMLADGGTTENLTLYQDGTQVGQSPSGFGSFPLSAQPATYKLVYDVSENAALWPTSTQAHTAWTFASQERAPDPLPPGWFCGGKGGGGRAPDKGGGGGGGGGTNCSFEPLLFTHYKTSAGLDDVIAAGGQATVDVTVSHQFGAAATPIASFSAQVSYDDGQTWHDVPATDEDNGVYRLHYTQPALSQTNGFASLHIQSADTAGSAIDQTITRAYPLAVTSASQIQPGSGNQPACASPSVAPYVACTAEVNTAAPISASQPTGLGPSDIQAAYNLSPTAGQGHTVAIVDAYDDPNAEADLAVFRQQYGLPACTSANGCFTKVNQKGHAAPLPSPDPGWGLEISLDLDAVSSTCPACKIVLVEANSASLVDLLNAVFTAQQLGANAISNSYSSAGEFSGERYFERYYRSVKVPFVVSTGDYGYGNGAIPIGGIGYPSASQAAIAVGGTTLTRSSDPRGWTESAWDGATSGCSAYIHKPGWQKDNLCSMRTVADVSAVADPRTGLGVYDTFYFDGWLQVGGTSLSAPIIASIYAMAGNGATLRYASDLYNHTGDLYDVITGANGTNCSGTYLCTAVPGYDGPTGLGTPHGIAGF